MGLISNIGCGTRFEGLLVYCYRRLNIFRCVKDEECVRISLNKSVSHESRIVLNMFSKNVSVDVLQYVYIRFI